MQETDQERALRVCYFGTYRANYGRNEIMIAGLRAQGATVYECHATLWHGIGDRVDQVEGGWRSPRFWGRLLATYARLVSRHARTPVYDVMVLGYPGPFDAYLGRLLSRWRRRPMVLDHYMSLYLIALERGLVTAQSLKGRLLRSLEGLGLRLPARLISDTAEYVHYHCQTYGLQPDRFDLVPAGADERLYHPHPELQPPADRFRIIYFGTFIPNHGVPTIVEAARLLRDQAHVHFEFYGDGPDADGARRRVQEEQLANVTFHGWVQKEQLPREVARSHLCLGVFGTTPQSLMTVQNKIWEAAAMARPLVTGDSPTVRAAFEHGENVYLVKRDDAQALAEAILTLKDDPQLREQLGRNAYRRFCQGNSITALGETFQSVLKNVVRSHHAHATGPQ